MKSDELKVYKGDVTIPVYGTIADAEVYLKKDVDAAIAELKARIQLDDDEMAGFLQLEEECGGGDLRNYIAELKQKLSEKDAEIESLKASHYAGSVDAGMRERRLRRALWLARALRARDIQRWWLSATLAPITERACRVWNNIEIKCRKKAEEYK